MSTAKSVGGKQGQGNGTRSQEFLFRNAGVPKDRLQLKEFFQATFTPLPAIARLLVTSETTGEVHSCSVDVNITGTNSLGNSARSLNISCGDKTGQSVGSIVRDADGVLFVFIGNNAKNGPEDFLARDRHVIAHVGEDCWFREIALGETFWAAESSGDQRCAFRNPLAD